MEPFEPFGQFEGRLRHRGRGVDDATVAQYFATRMGNEGRYARVDATLLAAPASGATRILTMTVVSDISCQNLHRGAASC